MLIETSRLILRKPTEQDIKPLHEALETSLIELRNWHVWALNATLETTRDFVNENIQEWASKKQKAYNFIVVHKENNIILSSFGFNEKSDPNIPFYEIGYWIRSDYTGQGLATEAVNALTRFAFLELKAARTHIRVQPGNDSSIRVAEKCGYKHEATLKNTILDSLSQKPVDAHIFSRFDLNNLTELEHFSVNTN